MATFYLFNSKSFQSLKLVRKYFNCQSGAQRALVNNRANINTLEPVIFVKTASFPLTNDCITLHCDFTPQSLCYSSVDGSFMLIQ